MRHAQRRWSDARVRAARGMGETAEMEARAGDALVRASENRAWAEKNYACAAIHRAFAVLIALTPERCDVPTKPTKPTTEIDYTKLPDQPMYRDPNGEPRFVENRIVSHMLDLLQSARILDLNVISAMVRRGMFTPEEYAQFQQLGGYSVSGFGELSQVPPAVVERCDKAAAEFEG